MMPPTSSPDPTPAALIAMLLPSWRSGLLLDQQTLELVHRLRDGEHFFGRNLTDDLVGVGVHHLHHGLAGVLVERELQALRHGRDGLLDFLERLLQFAGAGYA